MLYEYKRGHSRRILCRDCQTKIRCSKCKTAYELNYWSKHERQDRRRRVTALVCKACRTMGYHPADLKTYSCQTCQCELGAHRLNKTLLRNYKKPERNNKLQCKQCAALVEERLRRLRLALQQSKRKCKCFCRIHQSKCPLTPVVFGERRWPGSDGAISVDDRKFLDALNPPPDWWSKVWGR